MDDQNIRSKVFISCGQSKVSEEVDVAHRIAERLYKIGFDPYIAVEEQSLRGVKENIFKQIETSEYFIFIDFKREQLVSSVPSISRGSLFSHQELALASYLDMPILAFQEIGVKKEDGLLRYLQGNSIEFTDRHLLPNIISDVVRERKWDPKWKNEIMLAREEEKYIDASIRPDGRMGRYFHIRATNLHPHKPAVNCYAYLEKAMNITSKEIMPLETIEIKWAGYLFPNAIIAPKSSREFDAVFVLHSEPSSPQFNVFTDSTRYIPRLPGPSEYEMVYSVVSENFRPARLTCRLILSNVLQKTKLL